MSIEENLKLRLEKRAKSDFTVADLPDYLRQKVKQTAKVTALKQGQWVRVGEYNLLLKRVTGNSDDAWIWVVVYRHHPLINWLPLLFARFLDSGILVVDWEEIPNTNLLLSIWYVGDGSGGTALVVEADN